MRYLKISGLILGLVVAGCVTNGTMPEIHTVEDEEFATVDLTKEEPPFRRQTSSYSPFDEPNNILNIQTIYFGYNSDQYAEEDKEVLLQHIKYIKNESKKIILIGHSDHRGSRSFNLALGERRANTIKKYMVENGVDESRIEVTSYGEEVPVAVGGGEHTLRLNRRVEFYYEDEEQTDVQVGYTNYTSF
jgi:peptidoglycan-associated lipoprotein